MEPLDVDDLLAEVRSRLGRVDVADLATEIDGGAIVVDTRPQLEREAEGEMPGAVVLERNVLEWRLCPSSEHRLPGLTADSRVILFCNDGYASSLAAEALHRVGLAGATDLVGGYREWRRRSDGGAELA